MPNYDFINEDTNEEETHFVSIADYDTFCDNNPNLKRRLSTPGFGDPALLGVTKNPESWNHLVKNVKKRYHGSTIQTK